MNKKVLHYKKGEYLPLTETWIYGQIRDLKKYEAAVYCHEAKNLDIYPTRLVRSKKIKNKSLDPWTFFNKAWNKIFRFYPPDPFFLAIDKPDLIHAHYGHAGHHLLGLKTFFKIPLITTFYGYDVNLLPTENPRWKEKYKKLFDKGDLFLVEGAHMKNCLCRLGCRADKVLVHHLGIDLEKIKREPRKPGAGGEVRVLISASFKEKKGIPLALAAFGNLAKKRPDLKLKLTVIGDSGGSHKEVLEKQKILSQVDRYGLRDHVRFLGYQPHPFFIEELYRHHLFLSPSVTASDGDTEGGAPVSIIEASASGMPVLSTTHCDIPEVVLDGRSGCLVPEREIAALSEKLEYLAAHPAIWESMGLEGRNHIEKNYDAKIQAERLETIYDRATGGEA